MRSLRLNDPKLWLKILLLLQILTTLAAFIGIGRVGYVAVGYELPTPTCPQGMDSIFMPAEQKVQCREERIALYLPNWQILLTRMTLVARALCMISGLYVCKLRGSECKKSITFIIQAVVFVGALLLHATLFYPFGLGGLVDFVLHGP
jgi:hypothetical protein